MVTELAKMQTRFQSSWEVYAYSQREWLYVQGYYLIDPQNLLFPS